ncbi:hypothetical protein B9479_007532 [Cryptococcus floricola]|uniref:Uncharacterized protein n=1 Tax=Cryptococcus floricola TaxID=2591691 RepID=A0A5D3AP75_9TREE|nr:hypothetical protein B9479_007532 [Cryptococcus floricola]
MSAPSPPGSPRSLPITPQDEHTAMILPPPRTTAKAPAFIALPAPSPAFNTFVFPPITSPPARSTPSLDALPNEEFVFGDCPAQPFLGTPVAEQGPFEYPDLVGSSSSAHSSPRSSSFRTRRPLSISSQNSLHSEPVSPPKARRGSTNSSIATLPMARRPSIVHSATVEGTVPVSADTTPCHTPLPPPLALPRHRTAAFMYQQKAMPAPIPPSLLARRGSLPAAQLFGLPLHDLQNRSKSVNHGPVITAASLYQRRQSVVSDSAANPPLQVVPPPTFNPERRPSLPAISPSLAFPPRITKVSRSTSISHAPRRPLSSLLSSSPRTRQHNHLPPPLGIPPSPRSSSHGRLSSTTSSDEDEPETPLPQVPRLDQPAVVGLWAGEEEVESPVVAMSMEGEVQKALPIPMPVIGGDELVSPETPGLETVFERPPLETIDSGDSAETARE